MGEERYREQSWKQNPLSLSTVHQRIICYCKLSTVSLSIPGACCLLFLLLLLSLKPQTGQIVQLRLTVMEAQGVILRCTYLCSITCVRHHASTHYQLHIKGCRLCKARGHTFASRKVVEALLVTPTPILRKATFLTPCRGQCDSYCHGLHACNGHVIIACDGCKWQSGDSGMWQSCDNHMTYATATIVHTCVDPWPTAQTNHHMHFLICNGSLRMHGCPMDVPQTLNTSVDWAINTLESTNYLLLPCYSHQEHSILSQTQL